VTGQKIKLTVVRHGETNWNKEKRIQGQIDVPLNAKGIAQASAVAYQLKAEKHKPQLLLINSKPKSSMGS